MSDYRPLLDILTKDRTLPDGYDEWGMRSVRPDFRSSRGFRWPWPGQVAHAPGPIKAENTGPCPDSEGDGVCTALDAGGMASGGIPAIAVLLTAHRAEDVLGRDGHKLRLRAAFVVDVIDLPGIARDGHLTGADLTRADLSGANLYGANLYGADLYGADLSRANLYRAYLSRADLTNANLTGANLTGANLYRAYLSRADLTGANLTGANLTGANLTGADLTGANLSRADLTGARMPEGWSA